MKNRRTTDIFFIIGNSSIPLQPVSTLFQQILASVYRSFLNWHYYKTPAAYEDEMAA
jgi:hypothetical protein